MTEIPDIVYLSVDELHAHYRARRLSPVEVVEASLRAITARDEQVNAFVTVTSEIALAAARTAERSLETHDGPLPRLFGVPIGLKDLSDTIAGVRTTYGSRALADFVAPRTADHVQRLLDAGALVIGKTNTSEFGHKITTDNEVAGPTSTPFAIGYNAGGSSGGSAAAVAAGMIGLGLGSDGGGSIRVPAAACGVFGFKPTFGQVPWTNRPNAFATLAPFTHKGPLARSVADAAAMLDVMMQPLVTDPFGPTVPRDPLLPQGVECKRPLRIAYAPVLGGLAPEADVRERIDIAARTFADAGAEVAELKHAIAFDYGEIERIWFGLYCVFAAEAGLNLRSMGIDIHTDDRSRLEPSFVGLIDEGLRMSAMDFQALNRERTAVLDAVDALFRRYDLLLTPTNLLASVPNAPRGQPTLGPTAIDGRPVSRTMGWSLSYLFNLTGHPCASVPAGFTPSGVPVGLQIVGPRHGDMAVLRASAVFEELMPWAPTYRRSAAA